MVAEQVLVAIIYDVSKGLFSGIRNKYEYSKAVSEAASSVAASTDGIAEDDLLDVFSAELNGEIIQERDIDQLLPDLAYALKVRANTSEMVDFEDVIRQFLDQLEKNIVTRGRPEEGIQILYEYARETNSLSEDLSEKIEDLYDQYYDDFTILSNRCERMVSKEERYQLSGINQHIELSAASEIQSAVSTGEDIILTGPAGVGKSGVLAQGYHFWKDKHPTYFLDAREFGHVNSTGDIESELGVRNSLQSVFQRIGEQDSRCTVFVDQLDNVRTEHASTVFEHLLLDLAELDAVSVVCACRTWDLEQREFQRLRESDQFRELEIKPLDDEEVESILSALGIEDSAQTCDLTEMCQSLLNLSLLADVMAQDVEVDLGEITREIALWEEYRKSLYEEGSGPHGKVPQSWDESPVQRAVGHARSSLQNSTTTFRIDERDPGDQRLRSRETIEQDWQRRYRFRHDQLQSYFYAWDAINRDFNIHDVLADDVDERIAADVFEWMLRFYLEDSTRSTSFIRDALGSNSDLGFYARTIIADTAGSLGPENLREDAATAVIESLQSDPNIAREFYRDMDDPSWAKFLVEQDLLSDSGTFSSRYISRLATTNEQVVLDSMESYDSINVQQLRPYLSMSDNFTPDNLETVALLVANWVQDLPVSDVERIETDLNRLVDQLLDFALQDTAIKLISVMVEPIDLETQNRELGEYTTTDTTIQSRVEPWALQKLFDRQTERMAEVCGEAILDELDGHFRTCLSLLSETYEDDVPPEDTMDRYPELMTTNPTRLEVILLSGVEGILSHLLSTRPDTGARRLRAYLDSGGVFRQTAIGLLAKQPEQSPNLVAELLVDSNNYEDGEIVTEFIGLIGSGFKCLSYKQKQEVVQRIDEGPDEDRIREYVRAYSDGASESEVNQDVQSRIETWKLKRFYQIRDEVSEDRRRYITELIDKYGEIEYSPGSGYHLPFSSSKENKDSTPSFEGLSQDEFISSCLEHAQRYRGDVTGDEEEEIISGPRSQLSRELRNRILECPDDYLPRLPDIVETGDDEFVDTAFSAIEFLITGVDYQDTTIGDWGPIIQGAARFCSHDPLEETWPRDCRRTFSQMIRTIIAHVRSSLNVNEYETKLADILQVLLSDSDPQTSEHPGLGISHSNSPIHAYGVRATAVVATVHFFRVIEGSSSDAGDEHLLLWDQLEALTSDETKQVRFGFGKVLPSLFHHNEEFLRTQLDVLLPEGDGPEDISCFVAVWRGYMSRTRYSNSLFECLRSKFSRAITLHKEYYTEVDEPDSQWALQVGQSTLDDALHDETFETLCSHLAIAYARADISYDDELLTLALAITSDDLSSEDPSTVDLNFAQTFQEILANTDDRDLEEQGWSRIIEFWSNRVATIDPHMESGFRGYARVLDHAPPSATVGDVARQLKQSAPSLASSLPFRYVLEFLAEEVRATTKSNVYDDAIEVLNELVKYTDSLYRPPAADERWTVVKAAAADGNRLAIEVAEQFFEAGEPEYKQIIDRYKTD